jgi:hypothetical protein
MKNIFLLPTDKPSRLWLYKYFDNLLTGLTVEKSKDIHPQHTYITSDEEIKEGYYLDLTHNIVMKSVFYPSSDKNCKKIILTTDVDLIKDGVQAIDDEFLGWFVKNPSCESVKVERLDTFKKTEEVYVDEIAGGNYYEIIKQYKIIIPQEEPKPVWKQIIEDCGGEEAFMEAAGLKPKQETLEKVAKKQWGNVHRTESMDFIAGANLQAERMLTDGDLVKLLDFVSKEYNISNGVGWFHSHESIEDVSSKEVLDKWFEKYKINKL